MTGREDSRWKTGSEEWKVFRENLSTENIFDDEASEESKEEEEEKKEDVEEREISLTMMMMVITGPVPDVQCLVFSPVSIEVSERRDQS